MPLSDCANAQADQGLRCLHMPEDIFSHGAVHIRYTCTHIKPSKHMETLSPDTLITAFDKSQRGEENCLKCLTQ